MTELAYDRRGTGPTLVLIHGLGSHRHVWTPILDTLARDRDVITLDLPGFGDSPIGPSPFGYGSVSWFADRVESFLDGLGVGRCQVAGSSMGGGTALELGRRGRATTVTAFAPIGFWSAAGRRWSQSVVTAARAAASHLDSRLPQIMDSPAGRAAFCSLFYARPRRLDPADCVAAARALASAPGFPAARDAFAGFQAPVGDFCEITIAWGTRDAVLPFAQSRRARALLPAARHVTLKGCGHLPFADDPAACLAALNASAR
ncbi:alpha/beta fold hydrolase [Actinoplanes derwentensis]|uniref:Pimeloyl-ACP methyl ester carboxylesterase n=1 Tax=Actinoplanes derwentensis TaxID=113562 RepID=A0A1H2DF32_9ACTN|nr:alpha/beta fold hydrolase [Actinoplanes derwentensis]GID84738.1 hydrolase [Actinoplanes derwentensis]SDT81207.1 Pimeloyl-ACP methyl ester carboxylesterase [Actinoplanes derwentensis]